MNYFVRKQVYRLLDRYDILDDGGRLLYTADGFLTRLKGRLVMRDRNGFEILTVRKTANPFFANYTIHAAEDPDEILAVMRQRFSVRPSFQISLGNEQFALRGNLRASNFDILRGTEPCARVYKRELRWGDTYVVALPNDTDAEIYCALAAALDNALFHNH